MILIPILNLLASSVAVVVWENIGRYVLLVIMLCTADGLLQPDPHHAGTNLAAAGEERFIDEACIGRQAGRRQRDLNGHILTAAQQIEHSHVLARLPLVVPIAAELVENAVRAGAAGLTVRWCPPKGARLMATHTPSTVS